MWGAVLRLENILNSFDEFDGNDLLSPRNRQDYQSGYLRMYDDYRKINVADREVINDDIVFEIELIKQVEINVDYILMLVAQHREKYGDGENTELAASISRSVDASPTLRNKKDLIEAFIESTSITGPVDEQWKAFITQKREEELDSIILAEGLNPDATRKFIHDALRDGELKSTGTAVTRILPPVSRFSADGSHGEKKQRVLAVLTDFLDRFLGL